MLSSLRKNQKSKNAEEKGSRTLGIHQDDTHRFTDVIPSEEIDAQQMASPTSSVYSDARNSATSFSCKNMCFGDSLSPLLGTNLKPEKNIGLLGENIMKQIFAQKNFTTNKIVHIDIAPENETSKRNEESCTKDMRQMHEFCAFKNKISGEKMNSEGVLVGDLNTQVKLPVASKKIRHEDACDGERRVRWFPEASELEYFRRSFDEISSIESLNQSVSKDEHIPNFSRRREPSPEISHRMEKVNRPYTSKETAESFAQTDNPNEKIKKKSKFKTILLEMFLSCVRCFM